MVSARTPNAVGQVSIITLASCSDAGATQQFSCASRKDRESRARVRGTMPDTHCEMAPRNTALYSSPTTVGMSSVCGCGVDTEAGMLPGISRKRSIRSNPYWFTEFCNSQCLSHFAAPFIVVRAETSVAESCEHNTQAQQRRSREQTNDTGTDVNHKAAWRKPRPPPSF